MARAWWCLVLLACVAGADDDEDLVRDLARRVACLGRTRVASDYDLGPLLAASGEEATARRLLGRGVVAPDEIARLRRQRAVWALCALLDHSQVNVQAAAAEALALIADPRTAPLLWLHGRRHYVAYAPGTPRARQRVALEAAQRAIGMEPLPHGFDFVVRRWLTPPDAPPAVQIAEGIQRRADAGEEPGWNEILARLPPAAEPLASGNWRWYPIDDRWVVSCLFIHGLRTIRVEPKLPEATHWGTVPDVSLPPAPAPGKAAQIARLVRELGNPQYRNATAPDLPPFISGPRIPERAAVWDLLPHGGRIVHVLIPRLAELDEAGRYAGEYALRRVVREEFRGATEIRGNRHTYSGRPSKAWSAWLGLVRAGIPRGGLAIRLLGSRTVAGGHVELDYAIGWFGNWGTGLVFPGDRPAVTVLAEHVSGRRRTIRALERYEVERTSLSLGPRQLLLGRFLVPADGGSVARARLRFSVTPAPVACCGIWSGTIESNTIEVAR